jgi:hypothetical protein
LKDARQTAIQVNIAFADQSAYAPFRTQHNYFHFLPPMLLVNMAYHRRDHGVKRTVEVSVHRQRAGAGISLRGLSARLAGTVRGGDAD